MLHPISLSRANVPAIDAADATPMIKVQLKRAYDDASSDDGERILVERLWPRGVSKERLAVSAWMKEIAPSAQLRKWYAHDAGKWTEFRKRYVEELGAPERRAILDDLRARARNGTVTLVFAARDAEHSSAAVLRDVLVSH